MSYSHCRTMATSCTLRCSRSSRSIDRRDLLFARSSGVRSPDSIAAASFFSACLSRSRLRMLRNDTPDLPDLPDLPPRALEKTASASAAPSSSYPSLFCLTSDASRRSASCASSMSMSSLFVFSPFVEPRSSPSSSSSSSTE